LWFASNRAGGYGGYDLWQSNYAGGSWGAATNLGSVVNSPEADTHAHYYWDGAWNLYFASRRSGGSGGYDIYYTRYSSGRWSTPQNLGYRVNTGANETAPCLTPDGNYMFFQSNRGGGSGGNDIWVSEYVGGNWQPPVNLGSPINSNLGEASPALSPNGLRLVLDILNKSGGRGSYDVRYSDDAAATVTPTSLGKIKTLYR
jgi:Tol biopolymer transport system component